METITRNDIGLYYVKDLKSKDVADLTKKMDLENEIVEELKHRTFHPKFEKYEKDSFLVLRFPQFNSKKDEVTTAEIDFIISKDKLAIVQYGSFGYLEKLVSKIKKDKDFQSDIMSGSINHLLFEIINNLFKPLFDDLDYIGNRIDKIEKKLFDGHEEDLLKMISEYRRDAGDFKMAMKPNADVFEQIVSDGKHLNSVDFKKIQATNSRFNNLISGHIETMQILHETNESILSNKINQVMKLLTVFAAIMFPLTVISSIWGMNVPLPFTHHPMGFWLVSIIMLISTLIMLFYFKIKKWI